jgi:hypothetical protein
MSRKPSEVLAKDIDILFECLEILSRHLHQALMDIAELQKTVRALADKGARQD